MEKVILCIDDEKTVLNSLGAQLKRNFGDKFIYEFAEDAEEALELLEELYEDKVHFVVIISDWLMPGMKGDELLVKIHQKLPDVSTILLTGQADEHAIKYAKNEAGLNKLIRKPWSETELINTIKSGLK